MTTPENAPDLADLASSWGRSLRSANKSPRTLSAYLVATGQLSAFLGPVDPAGIKRQHVEAFISDQLSRWKASTASVRYRALQQFFKWLEAEGEIKTNPMTLMVPPKIAETMPPVFTDDDLARLVATCRGKAFNDRRDLAILRVFIDTGCRCAEIAGLRLDDGTVDLDLGVLRVTGKGNKTRDTAIGEKTVQALDRYLRDRRRHPRAGEGWLWLGKRGRMTDSGVRQMVDLRAEQAGITDAHPHRFRHTFAHRWLVNGGQEGDLMEVAGWNSRDMLRRYGRSAAGVRAREASRRLGLGDAI